MKSLSTLQRIATKHADSRAIPRFTIHKVERPSRLTPVLYEPCVCLILQGVKRVVIGGEELNYSTGSCLAVGAEVSALAQVKDATPSQPFISIALRLDSLSLAEAMRNAPGCSESNGQGFALQSVSDLMIETWGRLLGLLERPDEIEALFELYERELLYRLLCGPIGPLLRQIASSDSSLMRIRRSLDHIRCRHDERIEVSEMAKAAGMSLTNFHRSFKKVTGVTPLQYQKQLRLHEAKRLLVSREGNAASVAHRVGYESASQFSREYHRLFGAPPIQDAAAERELARV